MPEANGNLARAERMELRPGAVVAHQSEKALSPTVGTVEQVLETTGSVVLSDGTWVTSREFLRLVSEPRSAAEFLADRPAGQEPEGEPRAETAPAVAVAAPAGGGDAPGGNGAGSAAPGAAAGHGGGPGKGRKGGGKGGYDRRAPRRDHGLWLQAVGAIHDLMERGERCDAAIGTVAADGRFSGLRITYRTYCWWLAQLRREGHVLRSFRGGANLWQRPVAPADQGAAPDAAALLARCEGLEADCRRYSERVTALDEALRVAQTEAATLRQAAAVGQDQAGQCAERIALVEAGKGRVLALDGERAEVVEAVEVLRKTSWAVRRLRRLVGAALAEVEKGGEP